MKGRLAGTARIRVHQTSCLVTLFRVNQPRSIRNLSLIGFMGCGKTSVGRAAAELLDFEFVDTDELIEARNGKRIAQIFEQEGEAAFRKLEEQIVRELADSRRLIIATGGGLPTHQPNLDSLKQHALVVCLWASPEKIYERVKSQSHRPLLNVPDPPARIRELLEQRMPFYKQADVMVSSDGRTIREVAQQLANQFHLARKSAA